MRVGALRYALLAQDLALSLAAAVARGACARGGTRSLVLPGFFACRGCLFFASAILPWLAGCGVAFAVAGRRLCLVAFRRVGDFEIRLLPLLAGRIRLLAAYLDR